MNSTYNSPVKARILSCIGGRYSVISDGGENINNVYAKGVFRHLGIKPLPGDIVYLREDESGYVINEVEKRKNSFIRPALANLDILYIVLSCRKPEPVHILTDKMTVICENSGIRPVIVITKSELDKKRANEIKKLYLSCGYDSFAVSSAENTGIDGLKKYVSGKKGAVSAFCGASGVGKSTLINALYPELDLVCETGQISKKIERGKNTTRAVTLYQTDKNTFLADTPGFSLLDFEKFDFCKKEELPYLFPEFEPYLFKCKYTKCTHTKEDGCAIKKAAEDGVINKERYGSYLSLYDDIKDKKEWEN
ncbi:MAG: ribosome small subunit-dependent GTPase A [Clostridia bacterium]|nr:ribosome small subunit-dependent GTPase A [Clostridia bacterium]